MLQLDWPGHEDAIVLAPLDAQRPAGQRDRHGAPGQLLARRAYGRRAGGAAAGFGEPRAPLPDPQRDGGGRGDMGPREGGGVGVSPAPPSQTRSVMAVGEMTWASEMLARSGKIGWLSSIGPIRPRS